MVQLLIDMGADVNAQGGYLGSALKAASSNGHKQVVQLLLNNDADISLSPGIEFMN
ncbi:hypothetical protein DFH09DRAFT_1229214 [Mycena vulgaris]|nr:hypothetical protein DFH09DRAFT_1229214 [Mycena vulgaris]